MMNIGNPLLELCREPNCDGPAFVYSGRRIESGYQRYHRCRTCGAKFKTLAPYAPEDGGVSKFNKWLNKNVGRPPRQLTSLALFDKTVAIWQLEKGGR